MEIIERSKRDNNFEIAVKGKLDTNSAPELEDYINKNFLQVPVPICHNIIIDLSEVNYISSSGVRVIIATYKGCLAKADKGFNLYIKKPSDFCKQVFETIGIAQYLTFIK